MIRVAFSTLACPDWSLPQVIEAARRYGYDGVELRLIDGEVIDACMPPAERRRIGRLFASAGLPIVCVDSSIRLAAAADPGVTEAAVLGFLRLAHEWQAPLVRVFGGPWPPGRSRDQVCADVARMLDRAAVAGEGLGVAIVLETHDAFASAVTVAEVLKRAAGPAVGALWDLHHPYRVGERAQQVVDLLGDRLFHVHVKDARRRGDGGDLVLLGQGDVPVAQSLEALRHRGYDRWVSVEWEKKWHPGIPDPAVALPQHLALLRSWLEGGRP